MAGTLTGAPIVLRLKVSSRPNAEDVAEESDGGEEADGGSTELVPDSDASDSASDS